MTVDDLFIAPGQLGRMRELRVAEEVGRGLGGHRARGFGKLAQRGGIQMVHVGVRE